MVRHTRKPRSGRQGSLRKGALSRPSGATVGERGEGVRLELLAGKGRACVPSGNPRSRRIGGQSSRSSSSPCSFSSCSSSSPRSRCTGSEPGPPLRLETLRVGEVCLTRSRGVRAGPVVVGASLSTRFPEVTTAHSAPAPLLRWRRDLVARGRVLSEARGVEQRGAPVGRCPVGKIAFPERAEPRRRVVGAPSPGSRDGRGIPTGVPNGRVAGKSHGLPVLVDELPEKLMSCVPGLPPGPGGPPPQSGRDVSRSRRLAGVTIPPDRMSLRASSTAMSR
jgi:hypothetical protein